MYGVPPTTVTGSLKVTCTGITAPNPYAPFAADEVTLLIVGAVRSIVYTWPVMPPSPAPVVPVPPSLLFTASTMESLSTRLSPSVPLPVPVLAVTVYVMPLPDTPVIAGAPPNPGAANAKSDASTPVTVSLNVTVHVTLDAFDGFAAARVIEVTVGGVRSIVYTSPEKLPLALPVVPAPPNG